MAKKIQKKVAKKVVKKTTLLSGGNPQIAKGDGDKPVQAYLNALPGWKKPLGKKIDALIEKAAPGVAKAVKWNSPFYGAEHGVWFLSMHAFDKYLKVAFFDGDRLKPIPEVASKQPKVRYFHAYENEPLDEAQFISWVKQALKLPGERL